MERRFQEKNPENLGVPGKVVLFSENSRNAFAFITGHFRKFKRLKPEFLSNGKYHCIVKSLGGEIISVGGFASSLLEGRQWASSYKLVLENGELFKCCCDEEYTFFLKFRITDYRHCLLISLQSWLSHEVEVLVSVGQARQTLENLIDDRKVLSRQLAELRSQEQDEDDEPAVKVLTVCSSLCLCVCLSVSLSICLSVFLSVCPSLCLSVCSFGFGLSSLFCSNTV